MVHFSVFVSRLPTCCGESVCGVGNSNVDGVEETPFVKGRLGDMQIARLSLFDVNKKRSLFRVGRPRHTDGLFVAPESLAPCLTRRPEFRIPAETDLRQGL